MGVVAAVAALAVVAAGAAASVQSISVLPVTVQIKPGEAGASVTVINESDARADIQVTALGWTQADDADTLTPSSELVVSPMTASIAPRGAQVVRFALKRPAADHEQSYRVLIDQLPPAPIPGTVRIALRLSVPVFAEARGRTARPLQFTVERKGDAAWVVARNDGAHYQVVRDVEMTDSGGQRFKTLPGTSPYVLAGASHRWAIVAAGALPAAGASLQLTAWAQSTPVSQTITVVQR